MANTRIFPMLWESHLWCAETDAALLLALVAAPPQPAAGSALAHKNRLAARVASTVRWQMGLFYLGAAFWKVNTSFLDHRYSCAPLFFASIMAAYFSPHIATPRVTAAVIRAAPLTIVCGELAIAGALLIAAWGDCRGTLAAACCKVGVVLALCLHLGIAVTPPPNNVGAFSVIMAARLFCFAPHSSARVLRDTLLPRSGAAMCCSALAVGLAAGATALAAYGAHFASGSADNNDATSGGVGQLGIMFYKGLDWSVPTFVLMMWVVGGGVLLDRAHTGTQGRGSAALAASLSPVGGLLVCVAVLHSLALTPLGLQDLGGPNMYSNLRMQGGSNHLLLPTSLLHNARIRARVGDDANALLGEGASALLPTVTASLAAAFDGGLVRIEKSTSARINALYPGEISQVHSKRARLMLQAAGHSGRQFNPAMGRVLGSWVLPPVDTSRRLTRYTVPALEFRRMLAEARSAKEPFELEYSRGLRVTNSANSTGGAAAPSVVTDEAWRTSEVPSAARVGGGADASWDTFQISVDEHGRETCVCVSCGNGSGGRQACGAAEMEQLRGLSLLEELLGGTLITAHTHAHTHTHTHPPTHTHTHTHVDCPLAALSVNSHTHTRTHACTHTLTHTLSLSLSHTHTHIDCPLDCPPLTVPLPAPPPLSFPVWNPHPIIEDMTEEMHCFGP